MSNLTFSIIRDKHNWQKVLNTIVEYDFYHTFDYHQLSKNEGDTPILIKYQEENIIVALPFLLRKIHNTKYYDITSVYGYAGPMVTCSSVDFNPLKFQKYLIDFFQKNNIITVFSRLNPFLSNQEKLIKGIGEIQTLSKVVNINLLKTIEEQRSVYSKTTKRYVNKMRKLCDIKKSNSTEDIEIFRALYYENMDRVKAKKSYYFNRQYFEMFLNSEEFETEVLMASLKETNKIISAAMMVKTNNIVQYHISGTKNDYLHLTPIRILIDEMRVKATEEGYQFFNLGGGLGSSEDSLFNFKASFSKDFKNFKVWKYVVNDKIYEELCNKYSDNQANLNFFPLYRNKIN